MEQNQLQYVTEIPEMLMVVFSCSTWASILQAIFPCLFVFLLQVPFFISFACMVS